MKVRTKLTVSFLFVILLIWVTVLFAQNTYTNIHQEFEALEGDILPGVIAMSEIAEKAQEIKAWTLVYMIRGNVERKGKSVKEHLQETTASLEELAREHREHETHIGLEEQKAAEELENKVKKLSSAVMGIVNLKDQGTELDELIEKREEAFKPIFSPMVEQLEEHKVAYIEELAESGKSVYEARTSGVQVLLLVASLITLLAVASLWFISRSIVNPLQALHRGTEIIGEGNLDYKVGTEAKDEIGQLSRAFDQMTENLKKSTTSIDNLNKEITERKRAEGEIIKKNEELERFSKLAVGRELKMIELKKEINALLYRLGEEPCYKIIEENKTEPDK